MQGVLIISSSSSTSNTMAVEVIAALVRHHLQSRPINLDYGKTIFIMSAQGLVLAKINRVHMNCAEWLNNC